MQQTVWFAQTRSSGQQMLPLTQTLLTVSQQLPPHSVWFVAAHTHVVPEFEQTWPVGQQIVWFAHTCPSGQQMLLFTQTLFCVPQQLEPQAAVPLGQTATGPRHVLVAGFAQAMPAWQHAVPHCVVPAGQPHWPVEKFLHAMPAWQQHGPHGVVPAPHGTLVGPLHAC